MVGCPVITVNGHDPEAVHQAATCQISGRVYVCAMRLLLIKYNVYGTNEIIVSKL